MDETIQIWVYLLYIIDLQRQSHWLISLCLPLSSGWHLGFACIGLVDRSIESASIHLVVLGGPNLSRKQIRILHCIVWTTDCSLLTAGGSQWTTVIHNSLCHVYIDPFYYIKQWLSIQDIPWWSLYRSALSTYQPFLWFWADEHTHPSQLLLFWDIGNSQLCNF